MVRATPGNLEYVDARDEQDLQFSSKMGQTLTAQSLIVHDERLCGGAALRYEEKVSN